MNGLAVALLLVVSAAAPGWAQLVRGTVVEEGSNAPVVGVFVVLIDSVGRSATGVLTDEKGAFVLIAPRGGSWRLRAERIGHRSTTTAPFHLAPALTHTLMISVPVAAVELDALSIEGKRRCEAHPETGVRTAALWDEARKALTVTAWAEKRRAIEFHARSYVRRLDGRTLQVQDEDLRYAVSTGPPYAALSPDTLARYGFVRQLGPDTTAYYGPDAEVLLSDSFLTHHCFGIERGRNENSGLIGLTFQPVQGRKVPDIRGVLWIDARTAELRRIDYRFTGLPRALKHDAVGGRTVFRRLPNGAWMVDRWYIRMPLEVRPYTLVALREEGGEVTAVRPVSANAAEIEGVTISGVAFDSIRRTPLLDALVYLSGTGYRARTDSTGAFLLKDVPPGDYQLAISHPSLDSLPHIPRPHTFTFTTDSTKVQLSTGSLAEQLRAACPAEYGAGVPPDARAGVLFGYVRDGGGRPVARAQLSARLAGSREKTTTADHAGRFVLCGLPRDQLMSVTAQHADESSGPVEVSVTPLPFVRRDLLLSREW